MKKITDKSPKSLDFNNQEHICGWDKITAKAEKVFIEGEEYPVPFPKRDFKSDGVKIHQLIWNVKEPYCLHCDMFHEPAAYGNPSVKCIKNLKNKQEKLFKLWLIECELRKQERKVRENE